MPSFDKKSALAVVSDPQICTSGADLTRLQHAVVVQLAKIRGLENEAALRAIFAGIGLWRVRVSLGHGNGWSKWLEEAMNEVGARQSRYYMKLALCFLAKTKTRAPELLVLKDGTAEVVEPGAAVAKKAQEFVGDLSLNELLEKHGIKSRASSDDGEGDSSTSASPGEQMVFTEITEHFFGLRELLLKRERLMRLNPEQLDAAKREMEDIHARFNKLYETARGKKR